MQKATAAVSTVADLLSDNYLTEKEFCELLERDKRTVRRWHALRTGPPRISIANKKILYKKSSVLAWLESHESAERTNPTRSKRR